jgi:DNA polymerase family B
MQRQTILTSWLDHDRLRAIYRVEPKTRLYTRMDHTPLYAENKAERFICAENWSMSVEDLAEFMHRHGTDYSYISPASFAMSLYKKHFAPDNWILQSGDYRARLCRDALYGGRCEVYQYGEQKLYQYDINSSYPYASTTLTYPQPNTLEYQKIGTLENILTKEGVSTIIFSQGGTVPPLPIRHSGRILYPTGRGLVGTYTHTEIRYALQCGIEVHSIRKQYVAQKTMADNPFISFVDFCYTLRINTGQKIYKTILNSLFGRLAVSSSGLLCFTPAHKHSELKQTPRYLKDYFGVAMIATENSVPPTGNPLWASMVLSRARERLHGYATIAAYVDTDCFFSSDPIDVPVSDNLGDFKLTVGTYDIRGAKQYTVTTEQGTEMKLKGIARQYRTMKDFYAARFTQERMLGDNGSTQPIHIEQELAQCDN